MNLCKFSALLAVVAAMLLVPSAYATSVPTKAPTKAPTSAPSKAPTPVVTKAPATKAPTTKAPTKAPTKTPTKAPTEPAWIVRVVFNEGDTSPHKNCTDEDFQLVLDAVIAAGIQANHTRRQLGGDQGRKLGHNCAHACNGIPKNTCAGFAAGGNSCWSYAWGSCSATCRRKLQEEAAVAQAPTFLVLDELFYDQTQPDNVSGRRKLVNSTVSEVDCIAAKAKLYQTALAQLDGVATTCANLVLSPSKMQCLLVLDHED